MNDFLKNDPPPHYVFDYQPYVVPFHVHVHVEASFLSICVHWSSLPLNKKTILLSGSKWYLSMSFLNLQTHQQQNLYYRTAWTKQNRSYCLLLSWIFLFHFKHSLKQVYDSALGYGIMKLVLRLTLANQHFFKLESYYNGGPS